MNESVLDRMMRRVHTDPDTGCWIWEGNRIGGGYGSVYADGRAHYTHRLIWELLLGPIPQGMTIDHLCRVRACMRPDHLEPVTSRENTRRGLKGSLTTACPQGHPYDEANTRRNADGRRACRECDRIRKRKARMTIPCEDYHQ